MAEEEQPKTEAPTGKPLTAKIARTLQRAGVPCIVAEIRTAEQWAEAKGMLPEYIPIAAPFARPDAPKILQHNPQFWRYRAASASWPLGKELTEREFDDAVELAVNGHQYR